MNLHLKHYIYFSAGQAGKILGSMLATAILARYLDPAGFGRWTMLVAAGTLFHSFFTNWIQQDPFLRFGKQEWTQTGNLRKTWTIRLPLLALALLASLVVMVFFLPQRLFQMTLIDRIIAFGYFVSLVVSIDLQTLLQITGNLARMALAPMLISFACIPLYLGLWAGHLTRFNVEISLAGTVALTLLIWLAVGGKEIIATRFGYSGWDVKGMKAFLSYAWPILPTALLGYLMNWGNQVLIHRSFSNYEVGLYQSAFQVHSLLVTLAMPFTTILLPKLIDKHLQDPSMMRRFTETIAPTLFCLWLLVLIPGIAILPWVFIHIYGPTFSDGLRPLTALLAAAPFCALGQIYTGLFSVQGRLGKIFWIILTMVIVNFSAAWLIFPKHMISLQSVALSFSAAFILAQFLVYFSQHIHLHVPTLKITALFLIALGFSISEVYFVTIEWRLLASAFTLATIVLVVRQLAVVDGPLLKQIFQGRVQPLGDLLEKLLVTDRKVIA